MNKEKQILQQNEWLAAKREEIETDSIKRRFYDFIINLFKEKTTFERYGIFILLLQLVTIACSGISYMTSHVFTEKYISTWSPENAFYISVVIILLIELVKIVGGTIVFMRLVRWKMPAWWLTLFIGAAFAGSMYSSYDGGKQHVLNNSAPTLENIDSIKQYYDVQLAALQAEKHEYNTNAKYQNSAGVVFHTVLNNHVRPLTTEIQRLASLRDSKVNNAEGKNAAIEAKHDTYTNADAYTMAWIALGADLVKILISLITARFFVMCALDLDAMNARMKEDAVQDSVFGMLANMPPTEAPKAPQEIDAANVVLVSAATSNPRDIPPAVVESVDNSKNAKPCIVVDGLNGGEGMTEAEVKKKLRDYKSRLKSIKAGGKKGGSIDTVNMRIEQLNNALKKFV
jgi:flagellar biosynthesis chaperone FliJ